MLSKQKIKYIRSLEQKKYRRQESAFIAEGPKCVDDMLVEGFRPRLLLHTESWQCPVSLPAGTEVIPVTDEELRRASLLQHPQQVLAVFDMPAAERFGENVQSSIFNLQLKGALLLALDNVQDPGNLGTIIRTADWFGIRHILCSAGTADAYNPKTVQATMGSLARVRITYCERLSDVLSTLPSDVPVYGAVLDGDNIYEAPLSPRGVIIMGNEGNGISDDTRRYLTHKLLIPTFSRGTTGAESLNVSIATAIILSEFRRRQ